MARRQKVDKIATVSAEAFYARYFAANEPVLLEGFLLSWPAFGRWSPRYFADQFGHLDIEVMCELRHNLGYEVTPYKSRRTVKMRTFVEMIEDESASDDVYLVAQNQALRRPELGRLWRDLWFDPDWFDERNAFERVSLWIGPRNTVTPLHYDLQNALLTQAYGRKGVKLASPLNTPWLYNERGGYSRVDPDQPDLGQFPLFENASFFDVVIEPGDALFIPYGWWHQVRSLSVSVSLSLANFIAS